MLTCWGKSRPKLMTISVKTPRSTNEQSRAEFFLVLLLLKQISSTGEDLSITLVHSLSFAEVRPRVGGHPDRCLTHPYAGQSQIR